MGFPTDAGDAGAFAADHAKALFDHVMQKVAALEERVKTLEEQLEKQIDDILTMIT